MKTSIPLDLLLFILGMFFYGVRNAVGKWMVTKVARLLKGIFIKTERDLALYLHYRNKAYQKRRD